MVFVPFLLGASLDLVVIANFLSVGHWQPLHLQFTPHYCSSLRQGYREAYWRLALSGLHQTDFSSLFFISQVHLGGFGQTSLLSTLRVFQTSSIPPLLSIRASQCPGPPRLYAINTQTLSQPSANSSGVTFVMG